MKLLSTVFLGVGLCATLPCAHAKPKSWVQLSAATGATQYVTGAPIEVVLEAKNTHSRAAFLHFTSGQRFDLQLFRSGTNTPVYTWSASRMFAMMTGQLRLYPNQTQTFSARIGDEQGALVPGRYQLRASLSNSSQIMAQPIDLEIVASPVQLRATLDKTELKVGEALAVKITATNTSKEAQTLRFRSGQNFDIVVLNEEGEPVWTWAANKRFTMALRSVVLQPGESRTFDATWNGEALPDFTLKPGTHTIQAILATTPNVYAAPVRVEVR